MSRKGLPITLLAGFGALGLLMGGLEHGPRPGPLAVQALASSGKAAALVALATAHMRKARESGDATYYARAAAAIQRGLELQPRSYEALRILAWIQISRHEFRDALATVERLRQRRPDDHWLYGLLGDAHVELGRYRLAAEAYQKMVDLRPGLASYSRAARMRALVGDPQGGAEVMAMAVRAGSRRDPESLGWCLVQLGELHFQQGNLRAAEAAHRRALAVLPDYYLALSALGRVRGGQGRYGAAVELYRRSTAIVPAPDTVSQLGDLFVKIGRHQDAKKQYRLVEYIGDLNRLNRVLYNRELAYFYADHDMKLEESLELARKELEVRKDIYAYDVLAWSLYKNGKPQEALTAMREALRLGTKDARLFFHAGMIHHRLGEAGKAKNHLSRAVATNPHFHLLQADVALAALREIDPEASERPGPRG